MSSVLDQCIDGDVRIGGTPSVEVCSNHTWSVLCDNDLTLEDAAVICRQLGYSALGEHIACMVTLQVQYPQETPASYIGNGTTFMYRCTRPLHFCKYHFPRSLP